MFTRLFSTLINLACPYVKIIFSLCNYYKLLCKYIHNSIVWYIFTFRCLHNTGGVIQSPPATASKIVLATAVLHNMAKGAQMDMMDIVERADPREFYEPPPRPDEEYRVGLHDRHLYRQGQRVRDNITLMVYT